MKHRSLRYSLSTFAIVAAAGCGGSESSDTAGNGDSFAFDASAYKQKPPDTTGTAHPNCGNNTVDPDE